MPRDRSRPGVPGPEYPSRTPDRPTTGLGPADVQAIAGDGYWAEESPDGIGVDFTATVGGVEIDRLSVEGDADTSTPAARRRGALLCQAMARFLNCGGTKDELAGLARSVDMVVDLKTSGLAYFGTRDAGPVEHLFEVDDEPGRYIYVAERAFAERLDADGLAALEAKWSREDAADGATG